jgi:sortase A
MSHVRRAIRYARYAFFAIGIAFLGYAAFVVVDARMYQARELRRLERERQTDSDAAAAEAAVPVVAPRPPDGTAIGEIQIPRLNLSVVVVQGESEAILQRAVGHLPRTALPGAEGNVVLAGHRDTFFRPLKDIEAGDSIVMKTRERDVRYVVEWTEVVKPTDVQVLDQAGGHRLTLITCFPFYYVGSAPSRFIVFAREVAAPERLLADGSTP